VRIVSPGTQRSNHRLGQKADCPQPRASAVRHEGPRPHLPSSSFLPSTSSANCSSTRRTRPSWSGQVHGQAGYVERLAEELDGFEAV
jgi:hypothetical protein